MPKSLSIMEHPNHSQILEVSRDIVSMVNEKASYFPNDLFKLASLIAYGMHRPSVWTYQLHKDGSSSLAIDAINQRSKEKQAALVFSGFKAVHMIFCTEIHPKLLSRVAKENAITALLKDLLNKLAAVVLNKSLRQTRSHEESRRKQLNSIAFSSEPQQSIDRILDQIFATELDDQRKVFQHLLVLYTDFLTSYNPNSTRTLSIKYRCDLLTKQRDVTCSDLLKFNADYKKRYQNTDMPNHFYDFLRVALTPFDPILLNWRDDFKYPSFNRSITRPDSENVEIEQHSSPKSVAAFFLTDEAPGYSLFGGRTYFDQAMDQLRESLVARP